MGLCAALALRAGLRSPARRARRRRAPAPRRIPQHKKAALAHSRCQRYSLRTSVDATGDCGRMYFVHQFRGRLSSPVRAPSHMHGTCTSGDVTTSTIPSRCPLGGDRSRIRACRASSIGSHRGCGVRRCKTIAVSFATIPSCARRWARGLPSAQFHTTRQRVPEPRLDREGSAVVPSAVERGAPVSVAAGAR